VTGVCDSTAEANGPQGPNEVAFGQGYCEVRFSNRINGKTHYSENLCGTSENNKPNNITWKNEYCGYASDASPEDSRTKVYEGLCDDSASDEELYGPHLAGFNKGYCKADKDSLTIDAITRTVRNKNFYTETSFCNEDPNERPNDVTWKKEYCGYASATGTPVVLQGLCDDGQGPSEDAYNPNEYCQYDRNLQKTTRTEDGCENGDRINENEWKGQYCGYASRTATTTSVQEGVCDDGDQGPNSESFGGGYCTVSLWGKFPGIENKIHQKTEYTDEFCGASGKPNNGKWNGEYCGYANKNADDAEKVWTGVCDDGNGKHKQQYDAPGYCQAAEPATPGALSATQFGDWTCNGKSVKYNEGSWKNEYCFINQVAAKCPAGTIGDGTVRSDNANKCILPSTKARCLADSLRQGSVDYPAEKGYFSNGACHIPAARYGIAAGNGTTGGTTLLTNDNASTDSITINGNSGLGGNQIGGNCFKHGFFAGNTTQGSANNNSYDGTASSTALNASGAYVQAECHREITTPAAPANSAETSITATSSDDLKKSLCVTTNSQLTTTNSNCYGGPGGKVAGTPNVFANLGYIAWGSSANSNDSAIVATFVKKCEWIKGTSSDLGTCKITVTQATPGRADIFSRPGNSKGNCGQPNDVATAVAGTLGIRVAYKAE